ncbi:MAG: hypothetical protein AAB606_02985 [Patescibacteria group bacterium]
MKKLKIELGLSIEILSEEKREAEKPRESEESFVKIVSTHSPTSKKFEVNDFVNYYRSI